MATELRIVALDRSHNRTGFDCGEESLNTFLRERALKHAAARYSATYVLVNGAATDILAYYTICAGEFSCTLLPEETRRKLPRHPVPVLRLCRLATAFVHRGQGYGALMLIDALKRAVDLAAEIGIRAIEVDALTHDASAFYRKFGFLSLLDDTRHMYLPVATAAGAIGGWD